MFLKINGREFLYEPNESLNKNGKKLEGKEIEFELVNMNDSSMARFVGWAQMYNIKIIRIRILLSELSSFQFMSLPHCVEFDCEDMDVESQELPNLPVCKKLNCAGTNIEELPQLPLCEELNCENSAVEKIPDLPECKKLSCAKCFNLNFIPNLPNCVELDCSFCQITSIESLPMCKELKCTHNKFLESISDIPNVEELDCSDCPVLSFIGPMPKLKNIDMSNTNLDHREVLKYSNEIESFTPSDKFIRFKPALELLSKGINMKSVQQIFKQDVDYGKFQTVPLDSSLDEIPQFMTIYFVRNIDALYKLMALWIGTAVENFYHQSRITNQLLNQLEETYRNEVNPEWNNYEVVDFLASKYFDQLSNEFSEKLKAESESAIQKVMKEVIHMIFKNASNLYSQDHDNFESLKFKSLLQSYENLLNRQYSEKLNSMVDKLIKQAKKDFVDNFAKLYEEVQIDINPEEPNPRKRKRDEDESELPPRQRRRYEPDDDEPTDDS